jgi:hypothetical protein
MNKIENFNIEGEKLFHPVLKTYGYTLKEKIVTELNGIIWAVNHIYENERNKLKIEIKQEPYYTDYGFSFFLYKIHTTEYNILCNVPHENQDKEDKFLKIVCEEIFKNEKAIDLISGKYWKELKQILIQK